MSTIFIYSKNSIIQQLYQKYYSKYYNPTLHHIKVYCKVKKTYPDGGDNSSAQVPLGSNNELAEVVELWPTIVNVYHAYYYVKLILLSDRFVRKFRIFINQDIYIVQQIMQQSPFMPLFLVYFMLRDYMRDLKDVYKL